MGISWMCSKPTVNSCVVGHDGISRITNGNELFGPLGFKYSKKHEPSKSLSHGSMKCKSHDFAPANLQLLRLRLIKFLVLIKLCGRFDCYIVRDVKILLRDLSLLSLGYIV